MNLPNPGYMRELQDIVKNAPFPSHMSMWIEDIGFDFADIMIDLGHKHLQPYGIVHGGVIATIIDTATFWAAYMRLLEKDGLVNVDLKLNYLRPISEGRIVAKGVTLRQGKTISYAEAKVFAADGELIGHGTSTLMTIPGKGLKLSAKKFLDQ